MAERYPARSTVARSALVVAAFVAVSTTGCRTKDCASQGTHNVVTSALTYTEPEVAYEQRIARINAHTEAGGDLSADRARGTARVTNEPRSFDSNMEVDDRFIELTSIVSIPFTDNGLTVQLTVSQVLVRFERPAQDGTYALADLHATLCELVRFQNPADDDAGTGEACGNIAGTVAYSSTSASTFDADVTLSADLATADGPSMTGSAQIHYEAFIQHDTCPDIGNAGLTP
jgi:hypothetical protein